MMFDDFLNLAGQDLGGLRLIVFTGVSGSGKTTALRFLAESHASFRDRPRLQLGGLPALGDVPRVEHHLILCDEVRHAGQLAGLARLLRGRNTVAVASHLPPAVFWPFKIFGPTRLFRTDRDREKIVRHLQHQRLRFSRRAVDEYCRLYGANYLDLGHMLERFPGQDFDRAFHQFQKFCRLSQLAPAHAGARDPA